MGIWAWIALAVGAVLVGIGKTALPGLVSISVAMYAAVLPAKGSTALLLLLLLVGDLVSVWVYFKHADWRTLARLLPSVIVGVAGGAVFLYFASDAVVRRSIGVVLVVLTLATIAIMRLSGERLQAAAGGPGVRGLYGALGGFTTMAANSGGPVMTMYFLAAGFKVKRFLGTQAWFFFVINIVKLPFSAGIGLLNAQTLKLAAVLAPIVFISALGGKLIANRIGQAVFQRVVIALTLVSSSLLLF